MKNSARIAQEEIFGPVLTVIPFEDEAEAVRIANDTPYGLAGAVWSRDVFRGIRVLKQIRAGILWLNTYHPTYNEAPWGGYKQSGFGASWGTTGSRLPRDQADQPEPHRSADWLVLIHGCDSFDRAGSGSAERGAPRATQARGAQRRRDAPSDLRRARVRRDRHRRGRQHVHRLHRRRGLPEPRRPGRGQGDRQQAARFTHVCFQVMGCDGYVEVAEALARHAGPLRKRAAGLDGR